jgi:two-component system sensor histidine kinase TctE
VNTLNRKLLAVLLPALIGLLCGELWLSHKAFMAAANSAYDRSLAGAIKAIDASISISNGSLGVELPYRMLEIFQLTAGGRVFYRIATEDGLVTLGNADLPAPPLPLEARVPHFYDALYFGEPVRIGAYERQLERPLYGSHLQHVTIQVAETIDSRSMFTRGLLERAVAVDALLVLFVSLIIVAGMILALRPLQRIREEVLARNPDDLTPIDPARVPLEVRPLVDAINYHVGRSERLMRSQRQFLDDASHQLRTPLTVLGTQIDYASREPELPRVREALGAMRRGLDRAVRSVNQLLALAHVNNVDALSPCTDKIDLNFLAQDAARMLLPEARRKELNFSFVPMRENVVILGIETLLREAVSNLVDNAIRYVPQGGQITLTVDRDGSMARISLYDNGPGMPLEERLRVGERFRRGKLAPGGAGLGLAIAKAVAEQHGGRLTVDDGPGQVGITVRLLLPLCVE